MAKIKKSPAWLNNKFLIELYQSKVGVLFSNWLAQCMLYAETTEILFRLCLEVFIFLLLFAVYINFLEVNFFIAFGIALLTHTITFFINGQFYVLGRFFGFVHNEPIPFIEYPDGIKARLLKKKSIIGLLMFGSLSRKNFSPSSDLDIRVIASNDFMNIFVACFWTFIERFRALLNKYPLDVYVVTWHKGLEKLRNDEPPIVLFDKENFIQERYNKYYDYDTFKDKFLKKYNHGS